MGILLQELINLLHTRAAALGDPLPAAAIDELMVPALFRSHGINDGLDTHQFFLVDLDLLHVFERPDAGQHAKNLIKRSQLPDLLQLVPKILESEAVGKHFFLQLDCFLLIDNFFRLLDKRQNVAHAHNPRHKAIRMKQLQSVVFLPGADKFDRLTRDLLDR